jgi:predicted translin family RNA/ssDNA-binding protein
MAGSRYAPTTPDGAYMEAFKEAAAELDAFNERRERVVKASRDTTYRSKKVIFALHRASPATLDADVASARAELSAVRTIIANRIARELCDDDYPRLHRAFSPGIQEYVEAALFLGYTAGSGLVSREQLEAELQASCVDAAVPFAMHLDPSDYVLGVADLTGELMRLAVGSSAKGDTVTPFRVRDFLTPLLACFEAMRPTGGTLARDFSGKLSVFRQSLTKCEAVCFNISIREAEFGPNGPAEFAAATAASDVRSQPPPAKRQRTDQ